MNEEKIRNEIRRTGQIALGLLFLLNPIISYSQDNVNFERVAFEYFIDTLLNQPIISNSRILFDGRINMSYSSFDKPFGCFDDEEIFIALKIRSNDKPLDTMPKLTWIKSKETKELVFSKNQNLRKRTYIMSLYRSSSYKLKNYVLIRLDRISDEIEYFIEINNNGTVTNWCQTGKL